MCTLGEHNFSVRHFLNNCINTVHTGLAIKELCMFREGGTLKY